MKFDLSRCLIIGYGSIGIRHSRILGELGCKTAIVSRRKLDYKLHYNVLEKALRDFRPGYVLITNETSLHYETIVELANLKYEGLVLVEKPIFEFAHELPENQFRDIRVAYNLRFHPIIVRLKELLKDQTILSVHGYVGQYLPDWRPDTDYKLSYSADSGSGGGVLLDLSHELDYLGWLLGDWEKVCALGGHLSNLQITSDDIYTLMMSFHRCPVVGIQLNYLDRLGRRQIVFNTDKHTYEADLVNNRLYIDKTEEVFSVNKDDTYRAMHVSILQEKENQCSTFRESITILNLISAARKAAQNHEWVLK
jgi:predicted dehydrogenase